MLAIPVVSLTLLIFLLGYLFFLFTSDLLDSVGNASVNFSLFLHLVTFHFFFSSSYYRFLLFGLESQLGLPLLILPEAL